MPLPDSFLQELKARTDLAEIASSYVHLKRQGRNYVGLCPFHGEKTPSFHIYGENNSYYCFGCHAGGDCITFIRQIEHLDYIEAVRFLAERAGLQMPEDTVDDSYGQLKRRILEINRETARFYHSCLLGQEGQAGLAYLQSRALSPSTIRRFGLGFAPASRFALVRHLRQLGYTSAELYQANVAFPSKRDGSPIDRFANRVMFPIIDLRGNVVAFGGRIMTDEKPKYLNTADTPVFQKSNQLFAMNFAKNSKEPYLLLVEGYMDVIALHQAGITNAVATLGTALTPQQAMLMGRYVKEVVVSYDADEAGQKAAQRSIQLLRDAGLQVRVLTIPNGKDPDEFLRANGKDGAVKFRRLLEASDNDVSYQLHKLKQQYNLQSPEGRVSYLNGAAGILAGLDNSMEREVYAGRLAEEMQIDRASILVQVNKLRRERYQTRKKQEFRAYQQQVTGLRDTVNPEKSQHLRCANAEEGLLAYLLQQVSEQEAEAIWKQLPPERFCTAFNRRIYSLLMERLRAGSPCGLMELSALLSPEEMSAVSRMQAKHSDTPLQPGDAREFAQIILQEYRKQQVEQNDNATAEDIQSYLQQLRAQKQ